jgi:hypothetical protein
MHPELQFTEELEQDNTLNFLEITIHKTPTNIKISIYRKPACTDTLIPYTSNQPIQHKHAAVIYLYSRLNSYHPDKEECQHEEILSKTSSTTIPTHTYPTNKTLPNVISHNNPRKNGPHSPT